MRNQKLILICKDSDCGFVVEYSEENHNGVCPCCTKSLEIMSTEDYKQLYECNDLFLYMKDYLANFDIDQDI